VTEEIPNGIEAQTRACIENVRAILEDAGSALERVVDVTVFLTDIERDFAAFNRVYGELFGEIRPTRTTVGVVALPVPISIELKVIAEG
jgi:2-aminomuconate deaminase